MATTKKTVSEPYVDSTNSVEWRDVEVEIDEAEEFELDKLKADRYKRVGKKAK